MKLSVCLIVKNERDVLARCLKCARKFADEIVVADTGSDDGTAEIAEELADKVVRFEWRDDFAAARNFAFAQAGCELVMWLDADDVVTDENAAKINELKERDDFDAAYLLYAAAFDGDTPTFTYFRERIFRRQSRPRWVGAVHEVVEVRGRVIYSNACIYHKKIKAGEPDRNLKIYLRQIREGKKLDARQKFYYGRELYYNGMYAECAAVLERYLDGGGWSENMAEACITLYDAYRRLGEKERAERSLLRSFAVCAPKSRACCELGQLMADRGMYDAAIFWYKTAARLTQNAESGAFVDMDYCGFIPYIQLCVLYDRLGDRKRAVYYNELAGSIKPHNQSYLHNKRYFEQKQDK